MNYSKALALILSVILIMSSVVSFAGAQQDSVLSIESGIEQLRGQFEFGKGPEANGFSVDYRYYSPADGHGEAKYPLVIWLHGMGDGAYDGKQIEASNIANWSSAEFQSRFSAGGAYIFAPRSVEEKELYWTDELILPLRRAIDDFIEKNANVDLSRIYIGGYSMGGKMTIKMAVAYPELFAAAFPICPAWVPGENATELISALPVWLVSSAADPLVNYFTWVMPTWKNIIAHSSVAKDCRFSTLAVSLYPNGLPTSSNHHSWFAVNNDMFSSKNGAYPLMKTVDGNGEKVNLAYPDGMISWLCSFTSDYDGSSACDEGNSQAKGGYGVKNGLALVIEFVKNFTEYIISCFKIF